MKRGGRESGASEGAGSGKSVNPVRKPIATRIAAARPAARIRDSYGHDIRLHERIRALEAELAATQVRANEWAEDAGKNRNLWQEQFTRAEKAETELAATRRAVRHPEGCADEMDRLRTAWRETEAQLSEAKVEVERLRRIILNQGLRETLQEVEYLTPPDERTEDC